MITKISTIRQSRVPHGHGRFATTWFLAGANSVLLVASALSICAMAGEPGGAASAPVAQPKINVRDQSAEPEKGVFVLHKFARANGRESYTIRSNRNFREVKVNFSFKDRGTKVGLRASMRTQVDLSPLEFFIKGDIARGFSIDQALVLKHGIFHLRDRAIATTRQRPQSPAFAIAGYAPITFQMLLVRYWELHGRPSSLQTLPEGTVHIRSLGYDRLTLPAHQGPFERLEVEGLIWGRETLWFDKDRYLVAAVTTDAEFDHFEAIRERYEGALSEFIHLAGISTAESLSESMQSGLSERHDDIALIGGTIVDGSGGPVLVDGAVFIHNGKISEVGKKDSMTVPPGAWIIDTRGKWILPGLWDMHAHYEQVEWGPIYLAAGVTTVRDCGNEFDFITAARDANASQKGVGPRLLLAGLVDGVGRNSLGAAIVANPDQSRTWTRRYHDAGFQQMKIYGSMKRAELEAVATEAHRFGMTVTGHIPTGLTAYQAVEAGQDQINHIGFIAEMMMPKVPDISHREQYLKARAAVDPASDLGIKAIAFLRTHKIVIDPTLALDELGLASTLKPTRSFEPDAEKIAPELRGALLNVGPPRATAGAAEAAFGKSLELVGALHKAGVPIVAGTDQAVPGWSLHREMELYVQAGFTPMEAIQSATIVSAQAMGLQDESGTIEAGKRGDLIIVGGDPLEDISNLRRVEQVLTHGRVYKTAPLWRSVGFTP